MRRVLTVEASDFGTSIARKSSSFHVLPTENVPFGLRRDLCIKGELLDAPTWS